MLERIVMKIWRRVFLRFAYLAELRRAIGDARTVLDLGCGYSSPIRYFKGFSCSVGVDAFQPSIERSRADGIHDNYVLADVLEIGALFKEHSFDCVLAADLIEHLRTEDGLRLLEMMQRIATKRVVIFTPNGYFPQEEYDGNHLQVHLSGWTPKQMRELGYKVTGINGLKSLRGKYAEVVYRPRFIWQVISDLTQLALKQFPEKTFQILCVKELDAPRA